MTNNHLYWTVTTILQEQSGTRRAEIVKHMIKIASVLLCLVHPIATLLNVIAVCDYVSLLLPSLEYLKDLRNFNTMFAILRYVPVYNCVSMFMCVCPYMCACMRVRRYYVCDFCSLSGLNHSLVQRLKPTWEKVPGKYRKIKKVL